MQPSGALTRKKILYASVQVFLKKGREGATAKEIAALAGISSDSPFGMFGNKEGVLRELCVMAYTLPATVCVFMR